MRRNEPLNKAHIRYKGSINPFNAFIRKKGIKNSDISRLLGVQQATVCHWMQDPGMITLRNLYFIAGLSNTSVYDLMFLIEHNLAKKDTSSLVSSLGNESVFKNMD